MKHHLVILSPVLYLREITLAHAAPVFCLSDKVTVAMLFATVPGKQHCNGNWCALSPFNIRTRLRFGYPADKIKWYRGGMQNWSNPGLTTLKP